MPFPAPPVASDHSLFALCCLTNSVIGLTYLSCRAVEKNPSYLTSSAERQAEVIIVGLFPAQLNAAGWQGIDATDTGLASKIYHNAAIASGGDNIIGAIGGSIEQGIAKGQQRDFAERNAAHLATLQAAATSSRLTQEMDKVVRNALAQTPLAAKLHPPYQAKMFVNIVKSGYRRVGLNAQEEVLLTPFVEVDIVWMSVNPPKIHLNSRIERWAAAPHQHTAADFATQPALREAAFKANLDAIGREVTRIVKAKHGE
jgi:hypothetical protein